MFPAVARDRDELAHGGLELLLPGVLEPRAEHVGDLALRTAVHEDDEAEPELLLVDLVQVRELRLDRGALVGALLPRRALGQVLRTDLRVRLEGLDELV